MADSSRVVEMAHMHDVRVVLVPHDLPEGELLDDFGGCVGFLYQW